MVLVGYLLFAFIPLVLWLFVTHPEPIGLSLGVGVGLMLGHRFVARPYMDRVRTEKCLWCNRMPLADGAVPVTLRNRAGDEVVARCCPGHDRPTRAYLGFVGRFGRLLALGIFFPLLALLTGLALAALGRAVPLALLVRLFQGVVGVTVSIAAWAYLGVPPPVELAPLAFPLHNFFLLGVRNLLWIFRIVGAGWVVRALVP